MSNTVKMLIVIVVGMAGCTLFYSWTEGGKLGPGDPQRSVVTADDEMLMALPVGDSDVPTHYQPKWPSLKPEDNLPAAELTKLGQNMGGTTSFGLPWRKGHEDEVPYREAETIQFRDEKIPTGAKHVVCVWDGIAAKIQAGDHVMPLPASDKVRYVIMSISGAKSIRVTSTSKELGNLTRLRLTFFG